MLGMPVKGTPYCRESADGTTELTAAVAGASRVALVVDSGSAPLGSNIVPATSVGEGKIAVRGRDVSLLSDEACPVMLMAPAVRCLRSRAGRMPCFL